MNPIVTVIIPTYNRAEKISSTIDSVLKQTFTDLEVVVVNDGDDDKSIQNVIDNLADKRVKYIRNQRKKGANGARNTGLENAKGKYIAFLDDDDIWYAEKIQKQIQKFNESSKEVGFVYSGFEIVYFSEPLFFKKIPPKKNGKVLNEIIHGNFIGSPTPLIKKSVFPKAGYYDESLDSAQDWDLWIRIAEVTEFEYVNEILAKYVIHGSQISTDLDKRLKAFEYIIKKYKKFYKKDKKALATIYKKTAVLLYMSGNIKGCRKRIIEALVIDLFRLDLFIHLIFSFFPVFYKLYVDKYIVSIYGSIKLLY